MEKKTKKKKEEAVAINEHMLVTESAEDHPFISTFAEGRKYQTTYTKKFENRKPWVRPNPEELKSFIPGTVDKIVVKKKTEVKLGDELMYYTAMKMRNVIRAPFDGKVESILVKEGDRLPKGHLMMVIKKKAISERELKRQAHELERRKERLERIAKSKQKRLFEQAATARNRKKK